MTMMFRTVKTALVTTLDGESESRFTVLGRQVQSKSPDEIIGGLVQVYFADGAFPKSGRMRGTKSHDITIEIDMQVSATAKGDISVLDSATSTPAEKAAALLAVREAAEVADGLIDALIDNVWNILMDKRNETLGLDKPDIASRWIDRIQKDTLLERGDLVVKTANMKYTCRVQESVSGDLGNTPETSTIDTIVTAGDTEGAGVEVENS